MALLAGIALVVHAGVLAARARSGYELRAYNRWWIYAGIFLVTAFVIQPAIQAAVKANVVQAFRIPSSTMEPSILVGDYLFVGRSAAARAAPARNDVIVFNSVTENGVAVIKRVVGLPGDTLAMQAGQLRRNGAAVAEPWTAPMDTVNPEPLGRSFEWQLPHMVAIPPGYRPTMADWGPLVVPRDSVFVLGDNRGNSYDSRFYGAVPVANVIGRPIWIYLSRDREFGTMVRWDRIGAAPWVVRPN